MKIIQITHFGSSDNYGQVLQSYALQVALRKLGHEPALLKIYFSEAKKRRRALRNPINGIGYVVKNGIKAWQNYLHPRHFDRFREKNLSCYSQPYYDIAELRNDPPVAEAYMVGSDQVWSDRIPNPAYYLQFGRPETLRISYAASIGTGNILTENFLPLFRSAIAEFDAISVREDAMLDFCRLKSGADTCRIADPVALLSPQEYIDNLQLGEESLNNTCFVCLVGKSNNTPWDEIHAYCKKNNWELLLTMVQGNRDKFSGARTIYPDIYAWINHIRNAKFVVTNSFHGIMFALLFKKPFAIVLKKTDDARINTLDALYGIHSRICKKGNFAEICGQKMDYDSIMATLKEEREKGMAFLEQSLADKNGKVPPIRESACVHCGNCVQVCPVGAITMRKNFVPVADLQKCNACGRCHALCPVAAPEEERNFRCFYAKSADGAMQSIGSSGGIFPLLALETIRKGGVVCGAAFDENFDVVHQFAQSDVELFKLFGSKYVPSDIPADCFGRIARYLEEGRQVLFSGTPCQTSALRRHLGSRDCRQLLVVDCICHGVPVALSWQVYLDDLLAKAQKTRADIATINFRDKSQTGWHNYQLVITLHDGGELLRESHKSNVYMQSFIRNACLRSSCYACRFKGGASPSDLTLGDFWKIGKYLPELDDDNGCSMVIVKSPKGMEAFNAITPVIKQEVDVELVRKCNSMFYKSAARTPLREVFLQKLSLGEPYPCLHYSKPRRTLWQRLFDSVLAPLLSRKKTG